jgi:transcriptional regulator with PAS, ATPase and Fis domain
MGAMTDRPTVPAPPPAPAAGQRLWLMVMTEEGLDTHALPAAGKVVLGRDATCDVRIDHESVSRRHAALVLGPQIQVEDLGGVNGTHVGGARLERGVAATVGFGQIFHVGSVALVVQQAAGIAEPPRELVIAAPGMREVHATIARVAAGDISVLLLGETGVGKQVCAEQVHRQSPRRDRPMLELNCGALTESLLESELFGHERGAFSGAVAAKRGLLETADGGTVFLDEVGELPAATQVKLLRVLEERAVRPVGGLVARPIDVRFVAATNRDLEADSGKTFRADLYYRLAGVTITIPPLRERGEELEPLARGLIAAACARSRRPALALADDALAALRAHAWPGNVRELRNVIDRAVLLCAGATIELSHLPDKLRAAPSSAPLPAAPGWWQPDAAAQERARIVAALESAGGNQGRAAELLGMSRRTLLNRLDELSIPRPRKK